MMGGSNPENFSVPIKAVPEICPNLKSTKYRPVFYRPEFKMLITWRI